MKKLLFVGAIVLASLMAVPATAGAQLSPYYVEEIVYLLIGNDVMAVTSGNRRMVDEISRQGRRAIAYRSADLVLAPSGYGVVGPDGRFHRVSDRAGNLDPRVKVDYARAGILGAASGSIAGSIFDSTRIGVGIGGAVALGSVLVDVARGRNRGHQQAVVPAGISPRGYPMAIPDDQGVPPMPPRQASDQGALAGPQTYGGGGRIFTLTNSTRFAVEVYDGSEPLDYLFRLSASESRRVEAPKNGYVGWAVIPNVRGSLSSDIADIQPTSDGWVFIEPAFTAGEGVR